VVRYVLEELPRTLGRPVHFHVLCGTSVGALNACGLAAFADETPTRRAGRLVDVWSALDVRDLVKADTSGILGMGARLLGRGSRLKHGEGGFLDPHGLERLVEGAIPFARIQGNLRTRKLDAISVSATHVTSGRTVVFVERAELGLPPWSLDPTIEPRAVRLGVEHALASAAIPMLFRSVRIDGEWYCDGGLRQNVPLSPARRLGADGVLVINPRYIAPPPPEVGPISSEEAAPGPFFVLGKTLNALLLDRIDTDLGRLRSINRILEAGTRAYGPEFVKRINEAMGQEPGRVMRPMSSMLVRASEDIGKIAAEIVRAPDFLKRAGRVGRLLRTLADRDDFEQADLLSYMLFDGQFARALMDLGFSDARARHDELCAFFDGTAA
jgi:NTE family protein